MNPSQDDLKKNYLIDPWGLWITLIMGGFIFFFFFFFYIKDTFNYKGISLILFYLKES